MRAALDEATVRHWLAAVPDPEIPALSIVDLGIVRAVQAGGDAVTVTLTPTYSGCPAMQVIGAAVRAALARQGVAQVRIVTQLAPAWTTDWISAAGRAKLQAEGIAPPCRPVRQVVDITGLKGGAGLAAAVSRRAGTAPAPVVPCPRCGATRTEVSSQHGSTPCKALYRCRDCGEPFDYFKCH